MRSNPSLPLLPLESSDKIEVEEAKSGVCEYVGEKKEGEKETYKINTSPFIYTPTSSPLPEYESNSEEDVKRNLEEYAKERFAQFKHCLFFSPSNHEEDCIETEAEELEQEEEKFNHSSPIRSPSNLNPTRVQNKSSETEIIKSKEHEPYVYSCSQSQADCTYSTCMKTSFERHLRLVHNIGEAIKWHHCNIRGCRYKAKLHRMVRKHQQQMHSKKRKTELL